MEQNNAEVIETEAKALDETFQQVLTDESNTTLLKKIVKQNKHRIILTYVIIVLLAGCFISFVIAANRISSIEKTATETAEELIVDFEEFSEEVNESLENLDSISDIENRINIDGINEAIQDLQEAVQPINALKKLFK